MAERIDVVYDAECGFCVRVLRLLQRVDSRRVMQLHPARSAAVLAAFPMLSGADLEHAMFAIDASGRVFRGYFAFKRLLTAMRRAWPLLPLFYAPGADRLGPRVYEYVARHRHRLGCATDVCSPPSTISRTKSTR